jgi:hypothetical protein
LTDVREKVKKLKKKLIPSVCGRGGFGYAGFGGGFKGAHVEILALVQYDSESGGSHGGLIGGGAEKFTFGGEFMRTWSDWEEHRAPIALGGPSFPGASRFFGKSVNVQSRDVGGIATYEDGKLNLGLYGGATFGSKRMGGAGGYVSLSWNGCN